MFAKQTIQKITLASVLAGCASLTAAPVSAQQAYVAEIRLFAANYCPRGWYIANGARLGISQDQQLFSLIGNMYGGDGRTAFNLPDLRDQVPGGSQHGSFMIYCIASAGTYPERP